MIASSVKHALLICWRSTPVCLQSILFLFIAIAICYAFVTHPPTASENPSGDAGLAAALIALLAGSMAFIQAVSHYKPSSTHNDVANRVVMVLIALGLCASGYLWMAAEAGVHPSDRKHWGSIVAIGTMVIAGALSLLALAPLVEMHFARKENHKNYGESRFSDRSLEKDEQSATRGDLKSSRDYLTRRLYVLGLGLVAVLLAVVVNILISILN